MWRNQGHTSTLTLDGSRLWLTVQSSATNWAVPSLLEERNAACRSDTWIFHMRELSSSSPGARSWPSVVLDPFLWLDRPISPETVLTWSDAASSTTWPAFNTNSCTCCRRLCRHAHPQLSADTGPAWHESHTRHPCPYHLTPADLKEMESRHVVLHSAGGGTPGSRAGHAEMLTMIFHR